MKLAFNKKKFVTVLSVFIMIFVSLETLLFGTNKNETVQNVGYAIVGVLAGFVAICAILESKKVDTHILVAMIAFLSLSALTILVSLDSFSKYVYEFAIIILAAFFCMYVSFAEFAKIYKKIIFIFAVCSIATFALYEISYSFVGLFPAMKNLNNIDFYFFGLSAEQEMMPYIMHRSYGIFREPGVYVFYLILALIFELFCDDTLNKKHIIVLIIATLLTFSTAGWIVFTLVLLTYLLFGKNKKATSTKVFVAVILLVSMVVIFNSSDIMSKVFGKLFFDNTSTSARFDSLKINVKMIFDNIGNLFTGLGYTFVENNFRYYAALVGSTAKDNTNTFSRMFAIHGIGYLGFFCVLLFKFRKRLSTNKIASVLLFIAIVLLMFNENYTLNVLIYVLSFYSLKTGRNKEVTGELS